jgi:hypothetical protein
LSTHSAACADFAGAFSACFHLSPRRCLSCSRGLQQSFSGSLPSKLICSSAEDAFFLLTLTSVEDVSPTALTPAKLYRLASFLDLLCDEFNGRRFSSSCDLLPSRLIFFALTSAEDAASFARADSGGAAFLPSSR